MKTYKTINRVLKILTNDKIELVKGEGYHYFVFDDGDRFETHSVMIPHLRSWSGDNWVDEGLNFYNSKIGA